MTPEQFDETCAKTRLKDRTKQAARAVLVDGLGLAQAGRLTEPCMQRQQVADAVARIEREYLLMIGAPRGWKCLTLTLPLFEEEWASAEKLQNKAYARLGIKSIGA